MADFNGLHRKHKKEMEDFWPRRANEPTFQETIHVFGHPVILDSNHAKVLDSASLAEEMYSKTDVFSGKTWRIRITVPTQPSPGLPPERLIDLIRYTGADDWLSIDLLECGGCFVDMKRGEAYAILSESLAERPGQVCQVLINTILTNFITRNRRAGGWPVAVDETPRHRCRPPASSRAGRRASTRRRPAHYPAGRSPSSTGDPP